MNHSSSTRRSWVVCEVLCDSKVFEARIYTELSLPFCFDKFLYFRNVQFKGGIQIKKSFTFVKFLQSNSKKCKVSYFLFMYHWIFPDDSRHLTCCWTEPIDLRFNIHVDKSIQTQIDRFMQLNNTLILAKLKAGHITDSLQNTCLNASEAGIFVIHLNCPR